MTLEELKAKAQQVKAPSKRSNWSHLLEVVEILMSKRMTLWQSVAWLVAEGQVSAADQRRCYHSLNGVMRRRRKAKDNIR